MACVSSAAVDLVSLRRRSTMRLALLLLFALLPPSVSANDLLWEKLQTEADLVVLMRHTQPAGVNPLARDESGSCKGESLIASHRGSSPVVFVSHRPNIDLLGLELIDEGELLVARANENGELTVLGKIKVQP